MSCTEIKGKHILSRRRERKGKLPATFVKRLENYHACTIRRMHKYNIPIRDLQPAGIVNWSPVGRTRMNIFLDTLEPEQNNFVRCEINTEYYDLFLSREAIF